MTWTIISVAASPVSFDEVVTPSPSVQETFTITVGFSSFSEASTSWARTSATETWSEGVATIVHDVGFSLEQGWHFDDRHLLTE
jgi:hypothetical protein